MTARASLAHEHVLGHGAGLGERGPRPGRRAARARWARDRLGQTGIDADLDPLQVQRRRQQALRLRPARARHRMPGLPGGRPGGDGRAERGAAPRRGRRAASRSHGASTCPRGAPAWTRPAIRRSTSASTCAAATRSHEHHQRRHLGGVERQAPVAMRVRGRRGRSPPAPAAGGRRRRRVGVEHGLPARVGVGRVRGVGLVGLAAQARESRLGRFRRRDRARRPPARGRLATAREAPDAAPERLGDGGHGGDWAGARAVGDRRRPYTARDRRRGVAYAGGVAGVAPDRRAWRRAWRVVRGPSSAPGGVTAALPQFGDALERQAGVGAQLQLERDLAELPQRMLVGRLELEHLLVEGGGLGVEAFGEQVVGPAGELARRASRWPARSSRSASCLTRPQSTGVRYGQFLVVRDRLVHPPLAEAFLGLAGQFLASAHQQPVSSSSINRSNRVGGRKLRRWALVSPCSADGRQVLRRAVALVPGIAVARVLLVHRHHQPVTGHLGHDRGCRDAGASPVAL